MKVDIEDWLSPGTTVTVTFKVTDTTLAAGFLSELSAPKGETPISEMVGVTLNRWSLLDIVKADAVLATAVNALLYRYHQTGDPLALHSLEHIARMSLQSIWHPLPVPKADVTANALLHLLQSHMGVIITPELLESLKDELTSNNNS